MSPLALAAKNGRGTLVMRLLDSGADVMGSGGKIPHILATAEGHADVIEMLLAQGESTRHKYNVRFKNIITSIFSN